MKNHYRIIGLDFILVSEKQAKNITLKLLDEPAFFVVEPYPDGQVRVYVKKDRMATLANLVKEFRDSTDGGE